MEILKLPIKPTLALICVALLADFGVIAVSSGVDMASTGSAAHSTGNAVVSEVDPTVKAQMDAIRDFVRTPLTPGPLSTEFNICGEVKTGDGVMQTLSNAGGGTPHDPAGAQRQIVIHHVNGGIEVASHDQVRMRNPVVYPGDIVCDQGPNVDIMNPPSLTQNKASNEK